MSRILFSCNYTKYKGTCMYEILNCITQSCVGYVVFNNILHIISDEELQNENLLSAILGI